METYFWREVALNLLSEQPLTDEAKLARLASVERKARRMIANPVVRARVVDQVRIQLGLPERA